MGEEGRGERGKDVVRERRVWREKEGCGKRKKGVVRERRVW